MSFFAGFVNGIFNGMDWREARDDRRTERDRNETRWDWTQEDREYQVSERERVAREREEARARAAAGRAQAEARRAEEEQRRQADLQSLNESVDIWLGGGREPVSVMGESPQPASPSVDLGQGRTAPPASNARPAAESDPRPPRLEERARRDDKMLDSPRAPSGPAPTGFQRPPVSLSRQPGEIDALASELAQFNNTADAQASRATRMQEQAEAAMPAAQAAAAPRMATGAAPTAPQPQDDAAARRAQDIAAGTRAAAGRTGGSIMSVVDGLADRATRGMLAAGEAASNASGAALSAAQMPGAGAAAFRGAERSGTLARRPGMTPVPITQPRNVQMPPQPAQGQPGAAAQPGQLAQGAQVRPEVQQQAQASPEQAPRTASGVPVTSVQQIARDAVSIAPQARGHDQNSRQVRERAAEQFVEQYRQRQVLPIVEHLIRTGRLDEARETQAFFDDQEVRRGMMSWARAAHAYTVNDFEGMIEGMVETFNNERYYPDGLSVQDYDIERNEDGEVIGADITFRDQRSGRTFTQQFRGFDDIVFAGIGALAPEEVHERWSAMLSQRRDQRQPEDPDYLALREQAFEELQDVSGRQPTAEQIDERVRQIIASRGGASGIGAAQVTVMP